MTKPCISPNAAQAAMLSALNRHRFFKLIGGGSLTEAERLAQVARAYALAGVDCIDLAPDPTVVDAVCQAMADLPADIPPPALMVSLPLDPDPHFRKIELDEPACIRCGLCLPVCPTEALTLPDTLTIAQSLCYGCNRCVPVCPTEALRLLPFQVEAQIERVLSHPQVDAVEIHSRYVDPYMLEAFLIRWQHRLKDKLLALCFRPESIAGEQIIAFYEMACRYSLLPVIFQIDGAPMSGNANPEASRPALEAACTVAEIFARRPKQAPFITVSGGINPHTAHLLHDPRYRFVAGVGMGTVARQAVWHQDLGQALQTARAMIHPFKTRTVTDVRYNANGSERVSK